MKKMFLFFLPFTLFCAQKSPLPIVVSLHTHLEMAGAPKTLWEEIAKRNKTTLPDDVYDFQRTYDFETFNKAYFGFCSVLRTPYDFYCLMEDALMRAHARGIKLMEIIVSPQLAEDKEISWQEMLETCNTTIDIAHSRMDMRAGALLTLIKGAAPAQGQKGTEYVRHLIEERKKGKLQHFVGIHLSGPEEEVDDYTQFIEPFTLARDAGLGCAAHAGEWGSAGNIKNAIEQLGVTRVGHGIRAGEDPAVIALLKERKVHLEICPTSNVCTGAVKSSRIVDHPARTLFQQGVRLYPCNSDDPTLFRDTTEQQEAVVVQANLGFTDQELLACQRHAIEASFLTREDKVLATQELDRYERATGCVVS